MDEEVEAVEMGLCSTALLAAAKLLRGGGLMLDPAGFAKRIFGVDSALSSVFIVFFMRSWPSFGGGGGTAVGRSGKEKVVVAKDAPESLRELLRLFAGEAPS